MTDLSYVKDDMSGRPSCPQDIDNLKRVAAELVRPNSAKAADTTETRRKAPFFASINVSKLSCTSINRYQERR